MKKFIAVSLVLIICFCLGVSADYTVSDDELEKYFRAAVVISSFCGPVYPLGELLNKTDDLGFESIPTRKEQYEKYNDTVKNNAFHYSEYVCSYLTLDDLKKAVHTVFSDELADYYLSQMFLLKNRAGEPVYREVDGLIYDLGDYGDPGGIRPEEITYNPAGHDEYRIHVKYRYGWDLNDESLPPLLEDDLVLKKIDGTWKFTNFVSLSDRAYLSVYPDQSTLYPDEWCCPNPRTADFSVYITAAAGLIALCCAVVCKKKI